MACRVGGMYLQSSLSILENEVFESSCLTLATCAIQRWSSEPSLSGQASKFGLKSVVFSKKSFSTRRHGWKIAFALDTGGVSGNGGEDSPKSDSPNLGGTRLGRIVSAGGRQLLEKLNSARKNFPVKIFLLLLGFYTANALATILGQTGDWDVLVAGIVVAAIEGIGMLMYRKSPSGRLQSFVGWGFFFNVFCISCNSPGSIDRCSKNASSVEDKMRHETKLFESQSALWRNLSSNTGWNLASLTTSTGKNALSRQVHALMDGQQATSSNGIAAKN